MEKYILTGRWATESSTVGYCIYEEVRMMTLVEFLESQYCLDEIKDNIQSSLLGQKVLGYQSFPEMLMYMEGDEEEALMDLLLNAEEYSYGNGFIEAFNNRYEAVERYEQITMEYRDALRIIQNGENGVHLVG